MLQKNALKLARSFKRLSSKPIHLHDVASERPQTLQGSNRNYQKFVVLAHQRSGSTMVTNTLTNHPRVISFGELFNPGRIAFNCEELGHHSAKLLAFRDRCPIEFLEQYVFSSYPDGIQAVGFKLFPDQIDKRRFRCVWKWLAQQQDLKIIYLTRRNLLATYTSLLIAMKDQKYGIRNPSERSRTTVTIDPKQCLAEFRKRTQYEKAVDRHIQQSDVLRWSYEELTAATEENLKHAQRFLGVDVCDPKVKVVKQEVRPLSAVIENYDELRQYFSSTPWNYLFEDQAVGSAPAPIADRPLPGRTSRRTVMPAGFTGKFRKRSAVAGAAIAVGLMFVGFFLMQTMASKSAAKEQTVSTIGQVAARIQGYVQQHQELPPALDVLPVQDTSSHQAMDGWRRPLDYSVVAPNKFVIISYGADGAPGGSGDGSDIVCTYQVVNGNILNDQ